MSAHPALRVPAPVPVALPSFDVDVDLVELGSRQTVNVPAAATPGMAINLACAQIRASTSYRGPIVTHGYRQRS